MKLVCIPGLGVNKKVFTPQIQYFKERTYVPPFIEPQVQETMQNYCKRWARVLSKELSDPYILVGMSMGGMMAQELSVYLRPKAIVLLGSLQKRMPRQIFHQLTAALGQNLPRSVLKKIRYCSPFWIALSEGLSTENKNLIKAMIRESDIDFYKWQAYAAALWIKSGFKGDYPCPVFRAHGGRDTVLFLDQDLSESDLYLPKARHLISMTHPDQINSFIEQCMDKV